MRQRAPALVLVAFILAACSPADDQEAAAPAAETAPSPDESALEALGEAYAEHYNQQHATEVANFYSDTAFVLAASQAVLEGREEILAALQEEMKDSPTLSLTPKESMVIGDHAVGLGEYSVTTSAAGQGAVIAGSYLTLFYRENGQWKIGGLITNLNAEPPVDFRFQPGDGEAPPDNGTMKAFVEQFTRAYNASDWAAVASMYTADAQVAYSTMPMLQGSAAIQQRYDERFGKSSSPSLVLHDVGTVPLDDDWAVDGGWYTMKASPEGQASTQEGMYMNLFRRQPDGSWKIHWSVVNGRGVPDGAEPDA